MGLFLRPGGALMKPPGTVLFPAARSSSSEIAALSSERIFTDAFEFVPKPLTLKVNFGLT